MHDSWTAAFLDYGLRDWLMRQRRNDLAASNQEFIGETQEDVAFARTFALALASISATFSAAGIGFICRF